MSRKDYERIAGVIARFTPMTTEREIGAVATAIADSLANAFATRNPRFNRDRFLAACDAPARYFEQEDETAA